jgi:1-acyl-sn-glycerol-3-phosphate acyltransferase
MILKARHNTLVNNFFKLYTHLKLSRCFHKVEIVGEIEDRGIPILLLMNHISWWDGFWAFYLNMKRFGRQFHFMMMEEQLRKYFFFNKAGGYSVNKQSKSIIESLNYTAGLLGNPKNLVLLFPQGKIQSLYTYPFQFEQGVEFILKKINCEIQLIFVVNLVDYFSKPKPSLYMYISEHKPVIADAATIQDGYNTYYSFCLQQQTVKAEV